MAFDKLRPLKNVILFQFLDEAGGPQGKFQERTNGLIVIPKLDSNQKSPRWGKVVAVGPDVYGVSENDFVLIEGLQWTRHEVFEGEKIWMTNDTKVLMVTDDESLTTFS
jgi:co-chaperonin GroES (HSP10)